MTLSEQERSKMLSLVNDYVMEKNNEKFFSLLMKERMNNQGCIICSCSTEEQAEEGYPINGQISTLSEYCKM
jgi:hypothetical protein